MKTLALLILSAAMVMAADVTGKWTLNVVLDAGSGSPTFDFKQAGDKLTGTYHGTFGDAPLTGTVNGDKIQFSFGNDQAKATYTGTVEGADKMSGTVDYGQVGTGKFDGTRNK